MRPQSQRLIAFFACTRVKTALDLEFNNRWHKFRTVAQGRRHRIARLVADSILPP
jgi:hypothetical protein